MSPPPPEPPSAKAAAKARRVERLGAALRDNLKRRKAAARSDASAPRVPPAPARPTKPE